MLLEIAEVTPKGKGERMSLKIDLDRTYPQGKSRYSEFYLP